IDRLGRCADRRPAGSGNITSRDRDRRRKAVDAICLRLIEALEELPRMKRKTFDVTPLPLGIERVEGQARLSAAADSADHDQLVLRNIEIDMLQVMDGDATELDVPRSHVAYAPEQSFVSSESYILRARAEGRQAEGNRAAV